MASKHRATRVRYHLLLAEASFQSQVTSHGIWKAGCLALNGYMFPSHVYYKHSYLYTFGLVANLAAKHSFITKHK